MRRNVAFGFVCAIIVNNNRITREKRRVLVSREQQQEQGCSVGDDELGAECDRNPGRAGALTSQGVVPRD